MSTQTINSREFGEVEGKKVTLYTLANSKGMEVRIMDYGGTVTNILVPDKSGMQGDVVLGFDSLEEYLQKDNPYFGCLVGRYANRIANARFTLDGKTYRLAANNGGHSLHGGIKGFDKVIWSATPDESANSLRLSYLSPDGEEGYPGDLRVEVVYSLTEENELKIEYTAFTDMPTPVNLTNHSYFNLSAGTDTMIFEHELMIDADSITAVNEELIPTGKHRDVTGTAFDFRKPKKIGQDLENAGGYDHNYVLNNRSGNLQRFATVYHATSGRFMEVFTTEPGVQFYSGNFLDRTLKGKGGELYRKHGGFCLEAQHFPDSPNQPSFPEVILRPGETYRQTTVYKFSTR